MNNEIECDACHHPNSKHKAKADKESYAWISFLCTECGCKQTITSPQNVEDTEFKRLKNDPVNHPSHYISHPSGVECIQVTEHMNFNVGNAVKYLWRADLKNGLEDLRKARWYVDREIERREKHGPNPS